MSQLFTGSIDLNKISKELIQTTDKNGVPFKNGAKYINISIWKNETPDQYGNSISISIGGKENKIYIGNAKEYQKQHPVMQGPATSLDDPNEIDDLPF